MVSSLKMAEGVCSLGDMPSENHEWTPFLGKSSHTSIEMKEEVECVIE